MTNNDVFKKILHLTGLSKDKDLIAYIFFLGGIDATPAKIKGWRTSVDHKASYNMPDDVLEAFFQGFFKYRDQKIEQGINIFKFDVNNK